MFIKIDIEDGISAMKAMDVVNRIAMVAILSNRKPKYQIKETLAESGLCISAMNSGSGNVFIKVGRI